MANSETVRINGKLYRKSTQFPERPEPDAQLRACKAALDEYNAALQRREHGGVAASRCVEALEKVFYPEKFQPAGAVRQANQEN